MTTKDKEVYEDSIIDLYRYFKMAVNNNKPYIAYTIFQRASGLCSYECLKHPRSKKYLEDVFSNNFIKQDAYKLFGTRYKDIYLDVIKSRKDYFKKEK